MRLLPSLALAFALVPLLALAGQPARPAQAASCEFVLGFQALHSLIPTIVGSCLDDETHNAVNGDGLQATAGANGAGGGLLVWRKADNWTAYTDGYWTWINGPSGVQKRLNTQRFCWEADSPGYPLVPGTPACQPPQSTSGPKLMIPVISPSVASYANQVARSDDLVAVPSSRTDIGSSISHGRRVVVFASWADAESALPSLSDPQTIIAYDPEHWAQTPTNEQQNLVATVARASKDTHAAGHLLMVAPDRQFDDQYASQLAPYVDYYIVQSQRLESNPSTFQSWTKGMISQIRGANASAKIYVQVSPGQGTPDQMFTAIQPLLSSIDGIAVYIPPQMVTDAQTFVQKIRGS
jgi:hypothetical protein